MRYILIIDPYAGGLAAPEATIYPTEDAAIEAARTLATEWVFDGILDPSDYTDPPVYGQLNGESFVDLVVHEWTGPESLPADETAVWGAPLPLGAEDPRVGPRRWSHADEQVRVTTDVLASLSDEQVDAIVALLGIVDPHAPVIAVIGDQLPEIRYYSDGLRDAVFDLRRELIQYYAEPGEPSQEIYFGASAEVSCDVYVVTAAPVAAPEDVLAGMIAAVPDFAGIDNWVIDGERWNPWPGDEAPDDWGQGADWTDASLALYRGEVPDIGPKVWDATEEYPRFAVIDGQSVACYTIRDVAMADAAGRPGARVHEWCGGWVDGPVPLGVRDPRVGSEVAK